MPSHCVGDYWPECPREWSPMSAILTARRMRHEYGDEDTLDRAKRYQSAYYPDAWGYRHWQFVIDLVTGDATEAALLKLEPPGAQWPRQPIDYETRRATVPPRPLPPPIPRRGDPPRPLPPPIPRRGDPPRPLPHPYRPRKAKHVTATQLDLFDIPSPFDEKGEE